MNSTARILAGCVVVASAASLFAADEKPKVDTSTLPLVTKRAFPELKFNRPLGLTHANDGTNRCFVIGQLGTIYVFPNDQKVEEAETFLDIKKNVVYTDKENEEGLLGLAFHPKYKENGQFFVYYTPTNTEPHTTVVSRFTVSKDDPNKADAASEEVLISIPQPYWNHKGGTIVFGPDGYLYIGLGDGGKGGDPHGNGQNMQTLLGKILRIDVDHKDDGLQYAIPKDNPYAGQSDKARPEIWASGVRNIWRMSFDRETGKLWAGDVGQDLWEEINIIERGGNYGWKLREGMHAFGPEGSGPLPYLIDPIFEYEHTIGKSITGGHVYRGKKLPMLVGAYLYADYVSGKIWALRYDEKEQRVIANHSIPSDNLPVMSFGEDQDGEVYFTTTFGTLNQIVPNGE
ncbi:MAG: sorbosone dehydrogenase family protein [Planctomycetaceae bacterium]